MMSLSFYIDLLTDRRIRRRYARHSRASGRGSVILMYHHVAEVCPEGVSASCYSSIDDFKMLLAELGKSKQFVSLSDLCDELLKGSIPQDKIVITFDDVPEDVYVNAVPILRELNIPYTLYIATGLIGKIGFLSKEQVVELSRDPLCTIGSHTISHCMLKRKDVNQEYEFSESKKILEQLTGKPVEHFAYPYGTPFAISKKAIKQMESSDLYSSATCTIPAYINEYSLKNMFSLPRIHSQLFVSEYLKQEIIR